ncbi:MAG: NAD-dependent epimerase/dehydratase family protein [Deltaproteobacteria bacterium]|nr:NAD-dependent epimerase/dehydratase family protein [Deltaproteobacteria bacterium]
MLSTVTVLGGYGTFGSRISKALAQHSQARVRVTGRNRDVGENFARTINADFVPCNLDDENSLRQAIRHSHIVIHTAGPFQNRDYSVAKLCIEAGSHYLDLSDARQFVAGISTLDQVARRQRVFVSSGVSSVPAITCALIKELSPEFSNINRIAIGLSPGNQNPRGASTIAAILSYLGRPVTVIENTQEITVLGWGDSQYREFPPPVGSRRVHNCDVPDLELFPKLWNARTVRFYAGVELNVFNYALSTIALLRKLFALERLPRYAPLFSNLSLMLYSYGSKNGSLAVWLSGKNHNDQLIERNIAIVTDDDGPATPSAAAIVLTKKILDHGPPALGAFPCVGYLTLDEIMAHLGPLGIWTVMGDERGWGLRQ